MEINFEITKEDYIKFNLYHTENSPSQRKTYNLLRYLMPMIFLVPIYFIGTNLFKQPSFYWITIDLLFLLIWIVAYPKQYKLLIKREIEKLISEGDNSELLGKKKMIVDHEYLEIYNESSSEKILKSAIKDVKVHDDMILVYISSINAHVVPTRYLDKNVKEDFLKEISKV